MSAMRLVLIVLLAALTVDAAASSYGGGSYGGGNRQRSSPPPAPPPPAPPTGLGNSSNNNGGRGGGGGTDSGRGGTSKEAEAYALGQQVFTGRAAIGSSPDETRFVSQIKTLELAQDRLREQGREGDLVALAGRLSDVQFAGLVSYLDGRFRIASKPDADKPYAVGHRLATGSVVAGAVVDSAVGDQVPVLALWADALKAPRLEALAGRLDVGQFAALTHYLTARFQSTPPAVVDAGAFVLGWRLAHGGSGLSLPAADPARLAEQQPLLTRLHRAARVSDPVIAIDGLAGRLDDAQITALKSYLAARHQIR